MTFSKRQHLLIDRKPFVLEHHLWKSLDLKSWYRGLPTQTAWISAYSLCCASAWLILVRFAHLRQVQVENIQKYNDLLICSASGSYFRPWQALPYIMVQVLDCCPTQCRILIYCALIHTWTWFFTYDLDISGWFTNHMVKWHFVKACAINSTCIFNSPYCDKKTICIPCLFLSLFFYKVL